MGKRKSIPLDVIKQWLAGVHRVRTAAMNACRGKDIPLIRTIEPPETVYKKCAGSVIVCAHIPSDAQVRGTLKGKCRADKAVITEIIGDFCGEPVGLSMHDRKTTYYSGDEVVIENFDLSFTECSTGFHFFCSKEQAEAY